MPISVIRMAARSSIGNTWLGMATSAVVATTEVTASTTGTPAATIAPNAMSRMISVIGTDIVSARLRSFSTHLSSSAPTLASPNSSMRSRGAPAARCLTAALTGPILAFASSALSPLISND